MDLKEKNELINVSMEIIIDAGDARNKSKEALAYAREFHFDKARTAIKEAKDCINKAHNAQTDIIQNEARGKAYEPCLLFTHAQDTLMTIMSEVDLCTELVDMFELVNQRFEKLENK